MDGVREARWCAAISASLVDVEICRGDRLPVVQLWPATSEGWNCATWIRYLAAPTVLLG